MLKKMDEYDASLEAFSKPLMPLIDYALDDQGRMTVTNDTSGLLSLHRFNDTS